MKFAYPDMLFLLWIVAIAAGLIAYGIKKQKKILSKFASRASLNSIAPKISFTRKWIKGALLIFGLLFLVISISGPLLGYKWEKIEQKGVDIMIALDCSRSMLCQDIKPSRLKRAKREIVDLLRIMESDRAGLVAFAGKAILQCPLTLDHNAFNIFLDVLEPDYLPVGGTDIGGAIETCLKSFETEIDSNKAIILITDGENTSEDSVKEAAKKAAQAGVKIFCIGIGAENGAPIPDKNGGFKKDSKKNMIISKIDEKGLKKLAAIGSGRYVRSVTGDMDLNAIYSKGIRQDMEKKIIKSFKRKVFENRYQWFLLPCIILLFLEIAFSDKKKISTLPIILAVIFTFSICNAPICHAGIGAKIRIGSDVEEGIKAFEKQNFKQAEKNFIDAQLKDPDTSQHYYNIGTAAYKNQDYDSALRNFLKALESKDPDLKHKALYNIGNTKYRQGNLEESIKDFKKVIQDYPDDTLAQENLEFVKKKIQEQKQQDKNKDKNQGKDKDEGKDKSKDQQKNIQPDKNPDKGSDKGSAKEPDKKSEQQKEKPESQKSDKENNKNQQTKPQSQSSEKNEAPAKQNKQNMLNRLSDKPGKAMMPQFQQHKIEKDW
ncbi:MAG: VWA domain-containing protein [Desulfobacteraceae bacterium]|nr:VWA domain-containing protein [Desulfobacteraceae bacterium]